MGHNHKAIAAEQLSQSGLRHSTGATLSPELSSAP